MVAPVSSTPDNTARTPEGPRGATLRILGHEVDNTSATSDNAGRTPEGPREATLWEKVADRASLTLEVGLDFSKFENPLMHRGPGFGGHFKFDVLQRLGRSNGKHSLYLGVGYYRNILQGPMPAEDVSGGVLSEGVAKGVSGGVLSEVVAKVGYGYRTPRGWFGLRAGALISLGIYNGDWRVKDRLNTLPVHETIPAPGAEFCLNFVHGILNVCGDVRRYGGVNAVNKTSAGTVDVTFNDTAARVLGGVDVFGVARLVNSRRAKTDRPKSNGKAKRAPRLSGSFQELQGRRSGVQQEVKKLYEQVLKSQDFDPNEVARQNESILSYQDLVDLIDQKPLLGNSQVANVLKDAAKSREMGGVTLDQEKELHDASRVIAFQSQLIRAYVPLGLIHNEIMKQANALVSQVEADSRRKEIPPADVETVRRRIGIAAQKLAQLQEALKSSQEQISKLPLGGGRDQVVQRKSDYDAEALKLAERFRRAKATLEAKLNSPQGGIASPQPASEPDPVIEPETPPAPPIAPEPKPTPPPVEPTKQPTETKKPQAPTKRKIHW